MLFDRLCRIAERFVPDIETEDLEFPTLRSILMDAKIFEFPGDETWFSYAHEDLEFLAENFFLPFRTVAVEDKLGLVILHDMEENARGMHKLRFYINFFKPDIKGTASGTEKEEELLRIFEREYRVSLRDCYILQTGLFRHELIKAEKTGYKRGACLSHDILCTKHKILAHITPEQRDEKQYNERVSQIMDDVEDAFEELIRMNSSKHFVVEIGSAYQKR